jgi:3D (Asp-Asp-Asp) domain-containing protein
MAVRTTSVGVRPFQVAGVTTPASINASTSLTLPTTAQRLKCDFIEATVVTEGTSSSRYTFNGVTPTAAVGHLLPIGGQITIVGEDAITAFKIIGTAAGNTITYFFQGRDTR